jgi:hypothetical protein
MLLSAPWVTALVSLVAVGIVDVGLRLVDNEEVLVVRARDVLALVLALVVVLVLVLMLLVLLAPAFEP